MILTSLQIKALCTDLNVILKESTVLNCYALDQKKLIFELNKDNHHYFLFICLIHPFFAIHLVDSSPSKQLHFIDHILKDAVLKNVEAVNEDRIAKLTFRKNDKLFDVVIEFFSRRPNLYLLNEAQDILFSLFPSKNKKYHFPEKPQQLDMHHDAPVLKHNEFKQLYNERAGQLEFEQEKLRLYNLIKKRRVQTENNIKAQNISLNESLQWELVKHEADLLKSAFHQIKKGMSVIKVFDWQSEKEVELKLDPTLSSQEQIVDRYEKSKKLQKRIGHLQFQLATLAKTQIKLQAQLDALESISDLANLRKFEDLYFPKQIKKEKKVLPSSLPYYAFESASQLVIWVGKNAKQNDILTFQLARGSDWWMHVNDYAGSHVIIKTAKNQEPDFEALQDAMQLALEYSKAKDQKEAEICITQKKYVSKYIKDPAGRVHISKHKVIYCKADPERLKAIKQRKSDQGSS